VSTLLIPADLPAAPPEMKAVLTHTALHGASRRTDCYATLDEHSLPTGELNAIVLHMENYSAGLDRTFRTLSDPTRRAVLNRLMRGPAPVKELAAPFEMGLPSFMKHLRVLEESDLIRTEKAGRVRTCHVKADQLLAAESWLSEQRALWEARIERLANYVESEMPRSEDHDR
jgi:DNA-binding transcriptional ArsR family regulator